MAGCAYNSPGKDKRTDVEEGGADGGGFFFVDAGDNGVFRAGKGGEGGDAALHVIEAAFKVFAEIPAEDDFAVEGDDDVV
jgi:hypothetical protein